MKRYLAILAALAILISGGYIGAQAIPSEFFDGIKIFDDAFVIFGTDEDMELGYDEATDNRLELSDGTNLLVAITDTGTEGDALFTGDVTADAFIGDGSSLTGVAAFPVADTQTLVKGSADATKLLRVEVDGITTGTTRVWTAPDSNLDLTPTTGSFQASDAQLTDVAALTATKGNIIVGDGTDFVARTVGANGRVLAADSTETDGIEWLDPSTLYATIELDNIGTTAINADLDPDDENNDLGNGEARWNAIYLQRVRAGTTAADTALLQAYDTDGAFYTTFGTLTSNDTPTFALASSVTGVTQGSGDNSTKLATTAYVDSIGIGLPVIDTTAVVKGSSDSTKTVKIEADGLTTATARTITMPDRDVNLGTVQTEVIAVAASDETTALTTGTAKVTFRMPHAFTLTAVRMSLTTAGTGANLVTVDINEGGTTILSTKLTTDATEKTSTTAATAAVISDTALADDSEITIDIDQIDSGGVSKGLKVYLIGRL